VGNALKCWVSIVGTRLKTVKKRNTEINFHVQINQVLCWTHKLNRRCSGHLGTPILVKQLQLCT